MDSTKNLDKIKENLYSRQIGTYGEEAMKKIINLKILIIGLKSLGIEIAKNIILTGPDKVTIYDPTITEIKHLGLNYYLKENDIGKNRIDHSCIKSLSKLNPNVDVEILPINETNNFYEVLEKIKFDIIVKTELESQKEIVCLNEYCRKNQIKFIYGANIGLGGFIFSDFGKEHFIYDIDGEQPKRYIINNITNEEKAKIEIVEEDDNPFNLEEGDYIIVKNVRGMFEINDNKPRIISNIEKHSIYIEENTKNYHKYEGNGDIYEYKNPIKKKYMTFKDSIDLPFNRIDEEQKFTEQPENKLHANKFYLSIIITLGEYLDKNRNLENLSEDKNIIREVFDQMKLKFSKMIEHDKEIGIDFGGYEENEIQQFEEKKVNDIILFSQYNSSPVSSLIGGYISQEIVKSVGKYVPIDQWMFFDFYDNNFRYGVIKNKSNINNRYYDQVSIFGDEIQKKLESLKILVCGAGAVGCEFLKNLSLMGVSTGNEGCVAVTDYDLIENSNLNRQFLFNNENINQPKSKVACEVIKMMNKDLNSKYYQLKICKETETVFNKNFWESQDFIISGVDDNRARLYLNDQCFKYNKILLNIGTSGVRCKVDIIIPKITYPLNVTINDGDNNFNLCTVKKFPYKIEHCIQWAKEVFYSFFQENIKIFNSFLMQDSFVENLSKEPENVIANKFKIINFISDIINTGDSIDKNNKIIELCIYYYYLLFVKSIEILLECYPPDYKEKDSPFWSGTRKIPTALAIFYSNDKMVTQFIFTFTFILCQCLNIEFCEQIFKEKTLAQFLNEKFEKCKTQKEDKDIKCEEILLKLNKIKECINKSKIIKKKLNEIIFEKDGLNNNHLEFIQACANLRARNYNIQEENKNKILMISGKIIASVPTSTSSIVGYASLQIINLLYTHDIENVVKNAFLHLGLNVIDLIPQQKIDVEKENDKKAKEIISKYPKIEIQGSKTCEEFLIYIKKNYNYEIFHFEINGKILYDKRVTKDPRILQREMIRSKKKIEDLYFEQIEKSKDDNLKENILQIKINCRIRNNNNEIIENIYDFPLINYIYN